MMKSLKQAVIVLICALFLVSQIGCATMGDGGPFMKTKETGAASGAVVGLGAAHAVGAGYPGNKWMYGVGAGIGILGGYLKGKKNEEKAAAEAAEAQKQQ